MIRFVIKNGLKLIKLQSNIGATNKNLIIQEINFKTEIKN